jgi:hypothetical protein
MPTYVYSPQGLVDKATGEPLRYDPNGKPCAPLVLATDTLDQPVKSMADGKYYDSKAALRSTYKPSGNPDGIRYVEVGNETQPIAAKPKRDDAAITTTLQKALARYQNGERATPA